MRASRTHTIVTVCIAAPVGVAWAWADDATGGWVTWAVLGAAVAIWMWRAITGLLAALLVR